MDTNSNPIIKLPAFVNTRAELGSIVSEREKLEAELQNIETDLFNFEDSNLRRGGPYFGSVAKGVRADRIVEDIKSKKLDLDAYDKAGSESESGLDKTKKLRDTDRMFSNSSMTSESGLNKKKHLDGPSHSHFGLNGFAKFP